MATTFSRTIGVIAAAAVMTACSGEDRSPASTSAALNQDVRVGDFLFAVTRVELAASHVGLHQPDGVFVIVDFTAENVGDDMRTVYCQNQILKDLAGRTHDDGIPVGAGENMVNVKPGDRVRFQCAYDVPVGTLAGSVQVHDAPNSTGATVTVLSVG